MRLIDPETLRSLLLDGGEIALLDLRDAEAFQTGHLLLSVNTPRAKLEQVIGPLVPRLATRIVLVDGDDDCAESAAAILGAKGYDDLAALKGGAQAWAAAGFELFSGTYTINNVFSLFIERRYGTPRISAEDLKAKQDAGEPVVVLDSRPLAEFREASIPGAIDVPLAELIERVRDLAPDPESEIVVNCGGRARAVLGCQSLINAGLENPLSALYYGTIGWDLAGFDLARGATKAAGPPSPAAKTWARDQAQALGARFAVAAIELATLADWQAESRARTLYLIDVRSRAEYDAGHIPDSRWIPGGELVGLTEDHMATRNARICLVDDSGARATLTASWLRQMGWPEVAVLAGGIGAWQSAGRALAVTPHPDVADAWTAAPSSDHDRPARHAGYRRTIEAREALLGQLDRDATLRFLGPGDL